MAVRLIFVDDVSHFALIVALPSATLPPSVVSVTLNDVTTTSAAAAVLDSIQLFVV